MTADIIQLHPERYAPRDEARAAQADYAIVSEILAWASAEVARFRPLNETDRAQLLCAWGVIKNHPEPS